MRCVVKLLLEVEAMDDPAARKAFRAITENLLPADEGRGVVRELKLIEDRAGRLIDKVESTAREGA